MNNQGGNSVNQPLNKSNSGSNKILKQSKRNRQRSQKNDLNRPADIQIYSSRASDNLSVNYVNFSLGNGSRRYSYDE